MRADGGQVDLCSHPVRSLPSRCLLASCQSLVQSSWPAAACSSAQGDVTLPHSGSGRAGMANIESAPFGALLLQHRAAAGLTQEQPAARALVQARMGTD